ncbi:iron complex transport system substrate-binding protein [Virgibacillus natechei]|uniref:Iron complex transport system substrate-binding protein n=1 Tax=Virgibacillus natechei TaxID=1216297 RepID=A0ABS4IDK6_9BACI|nr:siderophore ABC transporter substrate-binding protein [Virgibacillus natechei]MBP1968531.1 iron complex transport system substrate-binding protein [Virgibacillus natechei]UZD13646.1 siderophore ABC transporter substrate-binding protein [Virgibacillus natechei]
MKRFSLLLIMSLFLIALAACGSSAESSDGDAEGEETNETVTVNHELGETEVPKNPENVVVFDYGILDTLDKLDVDVAGIAKESLPSYLEKYEGDEYENIGTLKEPDFENISHTDPDVIIISARQAELADQLEEIAPTIHLGVDDTNYMDSFKENMHTIGDIFDKKDEIEEELTAIEDSIASVNDKAAEKGDALITLANDDKISAYGPSSRFGLIHDVLGVPAVDDGIEASTHGMNVTFEYVVEQDPDLLYVVDRTAAIAGDASAEQFVENDLMRSTKAYENDDIYYLDPDYWYLSGGGLVSVSEMIKEIEASLD